MVHMNACCSWTVWHQSMEMLYLQLWNASHREAHMLSCKNWDYPNHRSSEYFIMINYIYTTTCRAHTCFLITVFYGCNYVNGYDINTLQMSYFYIKFCGQMRRVLCVTVYLNIHNGNLWAQDNHNAIHESGYQVLFVVRVWGGIIRDTVTGPNLLADKLTVQ
jgi:hypothetical protein